MAALPPLPAPGGEARVALVLDWESWWAVENPDHPASFELLPLLQRWYRSLHRRHVQVDLVHPGADLTSYTLVVAPQLYLLTDGSAANLTGFVAGGGHLVVTPFSDVVDADDRFPDGGYLTRLGPLLGVWLDDFGALDVPGGPGEDAAPVGGVDGAPSFTGELFAEELHADDCEVLGRYTGGRLTGWPALTRRRHGDGVGYHLGTVPDEAGTDAVVGWLLEQAGVAPVLAGLPPQVEAARRGDVVTLINHSTSPVAVGLDGLDVLAAPVGATPSAGGTLELPGYGWVMLRGDGPAAPRG
nr:beta-galactosidase trimerization domain-containing protein [Auraticoccus cholistanensis]